VRMHPDALAAIARVAAENGWVVQTPVVGEEGIAVAALWTQLSGGEVAAFVAATPHGETVVCDDVVEAIARGIGLARSTEIRQGV
jgi:hypothetical protein